jgi:translation initiation factor 2-alpha kinase 4
VDLPLPLLSQLTLDSAWLVEEEIWRGILAGLKTAERTYADSVREAVKEGRLRGGGSMWLFSVREARVSLLCESHIGGKKADSV